MRNWKFYLAPGKRNGKIYFFGTKWQLRKILFGSQRVKICQRHYTHRTSLEFISCEKITGKELYDINSLDQQNSISNSVNQWQWAGSVSCHLMLKISMQWLQLLWTAIMTIFQSEAGLNMNWNYGSKCRPILTIIYPLSETFQTVDYAHHVSKHY